MTGPASSNFSFPPVKSQNLLRKIKRQKGKKKKKGGEKQTKENLTVEKKFSLKKNLKMTL